MIKIWLIRPKPHGINRIREFLNEGIIALGWPELNSLVGKTKDDIKAELIPHPLNYSPDQLGAATATLNSFVNEIRINDIVVVPDGDDIYFCKVISDYYYDQTKASQSEGYPHQKKVEWIKGPIKRTDIPDLLRNSLRAPRTLADLTRHADITLNFINDLPTPTPQTSEQADENYVDFDYPIRLDKKAFIRIPKNITQDEAMRLGEFVKTLYFE